MTTSMEGPEKTGEGTTSVATNAESEGSATNGAAAEPEKAAPAAAANGEPCANCKRPLPATYYQVGKGFVCPPCKEVVLRMIEAAKTNQRFLPALGYGVGAAIAGSVLWYLVRVATGYEIGLVSIAIGIFVGIAVRRGSGGLGGRRYQWLAVALTYLSITMTNVPLILGEIRGHAAGEERKPATTGKPGGDSMIAPLRGEQRPAPAAAPPPSEAPAKAPPTLGGFVLAWLFILGIALAAPFLAGFENIIGIVIIGFGVYEAWKINRHVEPAVQGPFTREA